MTKLHELLAVEGQLKGQAEKTQTELRTTFEKKRHLFEEKLVTYQALEEGVPAVTEQQSDLQSTVAQELSWIAGLWAKAIDTSLAVADGNCLAKADIVVDTGETILKDVPVTALLELEKRAGEIQALVATIPTLDPAKGFAADAARGAHIARARDHTATRTKKLQKAIVLYPATPEHPAQTQLITEDVPVGKVTIREWSGLITPAEKADMLTRAEALRRAIKQARSRANEVELTQGRAIGKVMFGYVFGI